MFMILIHHFAYHGTFNGQQFDMHRASVQVVYNYLLIIGKAGVVAFVLIGAYFLSDKKFNFNRKQSVSTRLAIKNLVSYTKSNLSTGGFFYGRKTRYCSTNF